MKYIKTYEEKDSSPLKKLHSFLKRRKLNFEYKPKQSYIDLEVISCGDYDCLIYYKDGRFSISYIHAGIRINEKGERCGSWKEAHFTEMKDVYDFVKKVKERNDLELNVKKYNL